MIPLHYQENQLLMDGVPVAELAAAFGTPLYVYSEALLVAQARAFIAALPPGRDHLICFAVKANGNPHLLRRLFQAGLGADVTSGGEYFLARHAGCPPQRIIYSGVGKTGPEIEAALAGGLRALHVESAQELAVIAAIATARQQVVPIGVRVNPDVAAETHPHISTGRGHHKFGVNPSLARELLHQVQQHPWLAPAGLATHIGSQITDLAPFAAAASTLVQLATALAAEGIHLRYLDVGGGLGIDYTNETAAPSPAGWLQTVATPITTAGYSLVVEPGRAIVAPAGVLLTQVVYTKQQAEKQFVIVDAGMNDLLRPTLYQAHHPIWPARQADDHPLTTVDVVGPVCETGDFLAQNRQLPLPRPGDLLAILHTGAYGFAMSSNYNGRLRPAEVLVSGQRYQLIRQRQTLAHLLDGT